MAVGYCIYRNFSYYCYYRHGISVLYTPLPLWELSPIATLDADLGYRIWVFGALSPLSLGVAIHETTSPAPTPVVPLFLLGNAGVVPTLATLGPCLCTGVVVGLFPGGWVGFLGSLIPPFS